jgi:hypothetical protein
MMKLFPLLACAVLPLAAGCTTQGANGNDHWSQRSISNSMRRAFTGYEPERDGTPENFRENQWHATTVAFRRYFFNYNPDNPFETVDQQYEHQWYSSSQPPDTVNYDNPQKHYGAMRTATGIAVVDSTKSASSLRTAVGLTRPEDAD